MQKIAWSEITPESVFLNRRKFMIGAGSAAGALALAACASPISPTAGGSDGGTADVVLPAVSDLPPALSYAEPYASAAVDELGNPLNSYENITNYNNYYEFSTQKDAVAQLSKDFVSRPWAVEVTGLVNNPRTWDIDELIKEFDQEERIYRLRCVEAWSMVIPWVGFELGNLLRAAEPKAEAKYVKFNAVVDPDQMAGQRSKLLDWPYTEGLRLDEAMHPLTLMTTGLYGRLLPNANGAPLRLVVPWKYGFKSIKGIVQIELTDTMPTSTWMDAAANEYGFYANVNPEVNHPRWSQASERRIGENGRIPTLMFNGYEEEVADLYAGMDLRANF